MATKIVPAVPGTVSESRKVRQRVEKTRKEVRAVETKLEKNSAKSKTGG